ncbi:MAG TPA: DNA topology modulation protein [Pyrinomonadaceae bacterium]|nr:DNA topology modulation protein [Pyrinomonadaceae bacterium]
MKKIMVVGSGGAGKSTFSKHLGEILGIEVIHLDQLYWRPNWIDTPKDEWAAMVRDLVKRETWIMDGNFGGTRQIRLNACDTAIWLDIPRAICMYRVLKRAIVYRNRSRPDMAEGCNERLDWDFIRWVWNYPKRARTRIAKELEQAPGKRIVILRSRRDVERFLSGMREEKQQ